MAQALDLTAIGHIVQERVIFPDRESDLVLGSPPAYTGVTAARLGAQVGIVTRIGSDMPGHLLDPFRDSGCDTTGIHVLEGEPTTATRLIYGESGDKTIEFPAKANPITLENLPESFRDARMHYIATMDHDVPVDQIAAIAGLGRQMGIDLGGYGGAHCIPVERPPGVPDEIPEICKHMHIVKASDEDCRKIMADPDTDDEELGRQILDWGADIFVATRGSQGALVLTKDNRWVIPPYQGNAIDPTGGGDTFMAGYLVAYLRTGDPEFAGRFGAATALCAIEKTGGVTAERMPTTAMVEECMKRPTVSLS
jgi:sugar/nucleoside kinase (ribokinase family)